MTLIIGFNFGDPVVLTADSRLTLVNRLTGARAYDDDTEKVLMTGLGPIAAAGDATVIQSVADAINDEQPADSDRLRTIFQREMARHPFPNDAVVQSTSWLLAYHAGEGGAAHVGLASHLAQNNHVVARVPVGSHQMIPPFGMPDDLINRLNAILSRAVPGIAALQTTQEKVQGAMFLTEEVLRLAVRVTDAVSTRFQIGLRTVDTAGVSYFVERCTDAVDWQPNPPAPNGAV